MDITRYRSKRYLKMLSRLEVETRQADRVHREELAEAEGILHSGMEYPQKYVFSVPVMRIRASRVVLIIVKQGRHFPSLSLLSASRCLRARRAGRFPRARLRRLSMSAIRCNGGGAAVGSTKATRLAVCTRDTLRLPPSKYKSIRTSIAS